MTDFDEPTAEEMALAEELRKALSFEVFHQWEGEGGGSGTEADELAAQAALLRMGSSFDLSDARARSLKQEVEAHALRIHRRRASSPRRVGWWAWLALPALGALVAVIFPRFRAGDLELARAPEALSVSSGVFRADMLASVPPELLSAQALALAEQSAGGGQAVARAELNRHMQGYRQQLLARLETER